VVRKAPLTSLTVATGIREKEIVIVLGQPDEQKLVPSTRTMVPTPPWDGVRVMFGKSAAETMAGPKQSDASPAVASDIASAFMAASPHQRNAAWQLS
jgi:hypothetical protein